MMRDIMAEGEQLAEFRSPSRWFASSVRRSAYPASAAMYTLLVVSLVLFGAAGWRLPRAFLDNLQIMMETGGP